MANGQGGSRRGALRRRRLRDRLAVGLFVGAMLMVGVVIWLASGDPGISPRLAAAERARWEGRLDEALAAYRQVLREEPSNQQARWGMAQAYLERKDTSAAIGAFRTVHAAVPSGRSALALAQALVRAGSRHEARTVLQAWVDAQGDDLDARRALGDLELAAGRRAEARAQFERVLEAIPDDVLALARLARLYAEAGDPRARDFAARAYRLAPGSAEARDALGWLLVRSGELQDGLALLAQAYESAPADPAFSYHYAFALARTGDTGRASALLEVLARSEGSEYRDAAQRLLRELDRS